MSWTVSLRNMIKSFPGTYECGKSLWRCIQVTIKRLGWTVIQNWCSNKKGKFGYRETQAEYHMKKEAKIGVMFPQAKEYPVPGEARNRFIKRHRTGSSFQPSEGTNLPEVSISDFYPPSQTVRSYVSIVLSHLIYRPLLQPTWDTSTLTELNKIGVCLSICMLEGGS